MNRVWIMQGVSGAGKSSSIPEEAFVVSADDYFTDKAGKYTFRADLLGAAHAECLKTFTENLRLGEPFIVVDNTNTTVAEVAPYYALAEAYGYRVTIVYLKADIVAAAKRNVHNVPLKTVIDQATRLSVFGELMPRWWQRVTKEEIDVAVQEVQ